MSSKVSKSTADENDVAAPEPAAPTSRVTLQEVSLQSSDAYALCVDLDGTLVKSDTLADAFLTLIRHDPVKALRCLPSLKRGKAAFKAQVATHVSLNSATLPYNKPLLERLRLEHAAGRDIYLATATNEEHANRIARHLGIFAGVIASSADLNLRSETKRQALQRRFSCFDYVGNAQSDAPVLAQAQQAMLANPSPGLDRWLKRRNIHIVHVFKDRAPLWKTLVEAARVKQWPKNFLIFLPLLLAHAFFRFHDVFLTCLAFASWSFVASATYVLNDLLDMEADRSHRTKRKRPFAAGELSIQTALSMVCVLLALSAMIAIRLPSRFVFWLAAYFVTTIAYSLVLKKLALVDVIVLAGLYTVRMVAGAAVTDVTFSDWLGGFSIFFFLTLAIAKRYTELDNLRKQRQIPAGGRGYRVEDLEQLRSFGTASGYAAIVIFTLYINNPDILRLYSHFQRLWLLIPVLIYWINRVWLLAHRGELDEDPVVFALTDYRSALLGLVALLIVLSAV